MLPKLAEAAGPDAAPPVETWQSRGGETTWWLNRDALRPLGVAVAHADASAGKATSAYLELRYAAESTSGFSLRLRGDVFKGLEAADLRHQGGPVFSLPQGELDLQRPFRAGPVRTEQRRDAFQPLGHGVGVHVQPLRRPPWARAAGVVRGERADQVGAAGGVVGLAGAVVGVAGVVCAHAASSPAPDANPSRCKNRRREVSWVTTLGTPPSENALQMLPGFA